jgi:predicted PurR-regulated permease PerM
VADQAGLDPNAARTPAEGTSGRPFLIGFEPKSFRWAVVWVLLLFAGYRVAEWMYNSVGGFLFLMLLAWLLSIAMEPPVAWLSNHGWRRGLASAAVLFSALIATVVFLVVFGTLMGSQLAQLVTNLPTYVTEAANWINATFHTKIDPTHLLTSLNINAGTITAIAGNLAGGVFGVIGLVFGTLFDGLTMFVFAYYFSADGPRLRRVVGSWLPLDKQKVFVTVWDIAVTKTGGFVVSKVVLATLSAFFHTTFFYIVNVPYWLPMGIFAGVVSQFIPTIGTYIGVIIPAIFAAFQSPITVVWIIVFATVYQQIESYVFTPRVSRATMDVHPAIALGSVFVGVALFGPIGALIGIPLAAMVLAIVETYGQRYELLPELKARTKGEKPPRKGDVWAGDPAQVVPAGKVNDLSDTDGDGDTSEAFSDATAQLRDREHPAE